MSKSLSIPIASIENRFDVRTHLDEDTILNLADLYKSGTRLPPIEVVQFEDGTYAYVDGRHRAAARASLGWTDVPAIVNPSNGKDTVPLFAKALQANYGGSKPPTRQDIYHTVQRMVEAGAGKSEIAKALFFMPRTMVDRVVTGALSNAKATKVAKALERVTKGDSIEVAAKAAGVEASAVSEAITGKKRRFAGGGEASILAEHKSHITRCLRAANSSISQRFLELLKQIEAGEVDPKVGMQILEAWETNVKGTLHRIKDWKERLVFRTSGTRR